MTPSNLNPSNILNPDYGAESKSLLLEQYKVYVEMHDRISARRNQVNSFFISLLSGLLAVFSIAGNQTQAFDFAVVGLVIGLIGTILCVLWGFNIRAYRRLVGRKIQVIREMEEYLPFYCYIKEGVLRQSDLKSKTYVRPTTIEQFVSIIFGVVYLGLLFYSLLKVN